MTTPDLRDRFAMAGEVAVYAICIWAAVAVIRIAPDQPLWIDVITTGSALIILALAFSRLASLVGRGEQNE